MKVDFRLTLCAALVVSACAAPTISPADREALYARRFEALMRDKGIVTVYDPLEPIAGVAPLQPLAIASPAQRSIEDKALAAATAYAAANRSSAFIVWRDGQLQTEQYFGSTRRETPINAKSLAKPLTAIAVGRAIALGRIASLDQSLADFFPEWRGTPKAAMQVRHLLDMRSGLLEQSFSADYDSPINRAYIGADHGSYLVAHYPLVAPPGTRYGYANAPSELVALLIERATGRRYADFVGDEVLKPIGASGGTIWVDRPGGLAHSGCCLQLPAQSWLRLAILLIDDGVAGGGRLLPSGYVTAMRQGTPQNPHFGLGVWLAGDYLERRSFAAPELPGPKVLHGEPYLDRDLFLFDGNADQTVYISPVTRMIVLRTGDAPPPRPEWDNAVLPNLLIRGIKWKMGEMRPSVQPR